MAISATVNGERVQFDGPSDKPLLWALRDLLGMTGTKFGCGIGQCGACTGQKGIVSLQTAHPAQGSTICGR